MYVAILFSNFLRKKTCPGANPTILRRQRCKILQRNKNNDIFASLSYYTQRQRCSCKFVIIWIGPRFDVAEIFMFVLYLFFCEKATRLNALRPYERMYVQSIAG
jgi:hypothetical protein